jgi:hypothetical protein
MSSTPASTSWPLSCSDFLFNFALLVFAAKLSKRLPVPRRNAAREDGETLTLTRGEKPREHC